jgi:glutathione synthase/RimK-type ligase-like ATP-grasp enzyme
MIDYRNRKGPLNRIIPIQLNSDVNEKILKMMAELNLKSSSIDFIITKDDELVFLELNPVGQFGDISFYCNYNLEKEVVLFIKSELKVYA